jgi:hypothetical protein
MEPQDVEIDPDKAEPALLSFLRDYWQDLRGAREMPSRRDIAPSAMKARLPHILLADVIEQGWDFRYRLVGGELQRYFQGNPTGKLMSEALSPFGADTVRRTIETYACVVARRAPVRIRGTGSLYAQNAKLFDALLAPLSDDGTRVSMILGTFLFEWDIRATRTPVVIAEPDEAAFARALVAGK